MCYTIIAEICRELGIPLAERKEQIMRLILVMVDECGDEREVEVFDIPDLLDEDYLNLWKSMKIEQAYKRYPEARNFYVENRTAMERAVSWAVDDFFGGRYYDPDDEDDLLDMEEDYIDREAREILNTLWY